MGCHCCRTSKIFGLDIAQGFAGEVRLRAQKILKGTVAVDPLQIIEDPFGCTLANLGGDRSDLDGQPGRALVVVRRESPVDGMPQACQEEWPPAKAADKVVIEVPGNQPIPIELCVLVGCGEEWIEQACLRRE